MPSTDTGYENLEDDSGLGGGWGGYYDPTLIPGYYNVMGSDPTSVPGYNPYFDPTFGGKDPIAYNQSGVSGYDSNNISDPGTSGSDTGYVDPSIWGNDPSAYATDPSSGQQVPLDPSSATGYDPAPNPASDPGFVDPTTGEWVANPGYDPSTINNLPNVNSTPNVNPDPTGGQYDPTGGSGVPGDAYDLGQNTPVFQGGTTQQGPSNSPGPFSTPGSTPQVGTPQIPNPPAVRNPPIPPFPLPTPLPGPSKPPASGSGQNSPTPSNNMSLGLGGMPAISSTLPGSSNFSYQPISIARQGAPNAGVPPSVATQAGQAGATPGAAPSPLNPFSRLLMDQQNQQKKSNSIYDTGL